MTKLHILGICGTFMGGVAALAREAGFQVEGTDEHVYPPMSTQLEAAGIGLSQGYSPSHLQPAPDQVIVGNALSRGNDAVEYMLNVGLPYTSGPQWLAQEILGGRVVLAVAGTHGKTTTASMLAWILQAAGRQPGFLIGGVPVNFGVSARLGEGKIFVVEADEYDSAFFDKRAKFVHYRPDVLILNNLEYDHADIYPDLGAIQRQFHHLLRTVPGKGTIVVNRDDEALEQVLAMGCWSQVAGIAMQPGEEVQLNAASIDGGGGAFDVMQGQNRRRISWGLNGLHNVSNALGAIAAASAVGVSLEQSCSALESFSGVKRRLERYGPINGITVYDDFAHHPTAIRLTLAGLRAAAADKRLVVALEPRSNTMRAGIHAEQLAPALEAADRVYLLARPEWDWDPQGITNALSGHGETLYSVDGLFQQLKKHTEPGDQVVFMSNGSFGGVMERFVHWLEETDKA